jgi:tetratricopeptide (TPR) repeat protein
LLTGSAGLIVDISAKFLVPGVDIVGSLAVAGQSAIALVTGSTLVTQTGQGWLKRRLIALGIRDRYWHEAGCVGSLTLLLVLVGVRQFGFPWLADCYTRWGEKAYRQHRLETAGEHYDRALLFESDAIAARYLSGRLADEVDDRAAAQRQYWLAVQTDPGKDASMDDWKYYLQAASNLSRLYLLNKDPERAAQIAQDALDAIAPYPALDGAAVLDNARYGLYKNLGWARYARDRDGAAESWLQRAIAIAEATDRDDGGVAARCLLAKVLDRFGDYAEALPYWERCAADAGRLNRTPEEDAWSGQAAARLADPTAQPAKPSASSPY